MIQPMPGGGFIVVGERARYAKSGPEQNAQIYGPSGYLVASFCIGDGVNDVQVIPSSQIWASYGDEGVFGNYGWGISDGPERTSRTVRPRTLVTDRRAEVRVRHTRRRPLDLGRVEVPST